MWDLVLVAVIIGPIDMLYIQLHEAIHISSLHRWPLCSFLMYDTHEITESIRFGGHLCLRGIVNCSEIAG